MLQLRSEFPLVNTKQLGVPVLFSVFFLTLPPLDMSGFAPHIPSYLHPDLTQLRLPCFTQGTDCRTCYAKTCLTTIQISVAPEYCCLGTETEHW